MQNKIILYRNGAHFLCNQEFSKCFKIQEESKLLIYSETVTKILNLCKVFVSNQY